MYVLFRAGVNLVFEHARVEVVLTVAMPILKKSFGFLTGENMKTPQI